MAFSYYYHKFIPNFAEITLPLYKLCNKKIVFYNNYGKYSKELMVITDIGKCAFGNVFLDTIGPLVSDSSNYRYILTIQCDLTKFIILSPKSIHFSLKTRLQQLCQALSIIFYFATEFQVKLLQIRDRIYF